MGNFGPMIERAKTLKEYDELILASRNKTSVNVTKKPEKPASNLYCFFSHKNNIHTLENKISTAQAVTSPVKTSPLKRTKKSGKINPQELPMYTDRTTINVFGEDPCINSPSQKPSKVSLLIEKLMAIFKEKK